MRSIMRYAWNTGAQEVLPVPECREKRLLAVPARATRDRDWGQEGARQMTRPAEAWRADREEQLRIEALHVDLSAQFVRVPADEMNRLIEEAQRRIVQALGLDRSTLLQRTESEDDLVITHTWAVPECAAKPGLFAKRDFP
jgi:hypothetical protein